MADLIVANGIVITVDPRRRILEDGAVVISKDRITDVGSTRDILARHQAARIIDAKGKAVIPGLIDVHAHAGHGLTKTIGTADGDKWGDACDVAYRLASTPAFWRAEAQLAALERLRFGVTTGMSLFGGGRDMLMRTDDPEFGDAHCEGVAEIGTRSIVGLGPTLPPHPLDYATWQGDHQTLHAVDFARQMATCDTLIGRWHGAHGQRLNIALVASTVMPGYEARADFDEIVRQVRKVHEMSRERGLLFTQDGHVKGSVAIAESLGLLGSDALLSHAIDLTEEEIRICARTNTRIAHNPSAIMSIIGRCPAPELMAAGAVVAIGSDATAPDRSADMFRHMQQFMHYHRRHFRDPKLLPPGRTFEMCTIDAARALGMERDIGSLEAGKKADITLVDLRRPHIYPLNMPVHRLVCFANGNDVHTVIVDGRVVLENRKALLVDEDAVLDAAQRETEAMLDRSGLHALVETTPGVWGRA